MVMVQGSGAAAFEAGDVAARKESTRRSLSTDKWRGLSLGRELTGM